MRTMTSWTSPATPTFCWRSPMPDLSSRIRTEVERVRQLAEAATPGPWIAEYSGPTGNCVIPADAQSTLEYVARTQLYAAYFDAQHIAAWNPATALRMCAWALKVLDRHPHRPRSIDAAVDDTGEPHPGVCDRCEPGRRHWPCESITDVAEAFGISLTEETTDQAEVATDG